MSYNFFKAMFKGYLLCEALLGHPALAPSVTPPHPSPTWSFLWMLLLRWTFP